MISPSGSPNAHSPVDLVQMDLRIDELSQRVNSLQQELAKARNELQTLMAQRSEMSQRVQPDPTANVLQKSPVAERIFRACTVSPNLEILFQEDPLDGESLKVCLDPSMSTQMKREEVDEVNMNTVLMGGTPHHELILKSREGKIRFASKSLENIRQLFSSIMKPDPDLLKSCKLFSLQKPRVAYITGAMKDGLGDPWTSHLSKVLRDQYGISLQKEPKEGAVERPYVLFNVFQKQLRNPSPLTLRSWSNENNLRSGGNGVWLVLENVRYKDQCDALGSPELTESGLFMNEPHRRIPRVLTFSDTYKSEDITKKVNALAHEIADLVDKVSDEGVLASAYHPDFEFLNRTKAINNEVSTEGVPSMEKAKRIIEPWMLDPQHATQIKMKTILAKGKLRYECVTKLQEEKIRRMSESADLIRQYFNIAKQPMPCQLLPLRKPRVAYITGQVQADLRENLLATKLAEVLKYDYSVDLRYEPLNPPKQPYLLFYALVLSPSRRPQPIDMETWSKEGIKRSGGSCVWLCIKPGGYETDSMTQRQIPLSGLFMDDARKAMPTILHAPSFKTHDSTESIQFTHMLASSMADLVDRVSGTGL